jgi:hypothetical protein
MPETELEFRVAEIAELMARVGSLELHLSAVEDRLASVMAALSGLGDELSDSERTQRLILTEVRTLAATVKKLIPLRPYRQL